MGRFHHRMAGERGNGRTNLLAGLTLGSLVGSLLLSGLALLEKGLRDQDLVLGGDATIVMC